MVKKFQYTFNVDDQKKKKKKRVVSVWPSLPGLVLNNTSNQIISTQFLVLGFVLLSICLVSFLAINFDFVLGKSNAYI